MAEKQGEFGSATSKMMNPLQPPPPLPYLLAQELTSQSPSSLLPLSASSSNGVDNGTIKRDQRHPFDSSAENVEIQEELKRSSATPLREERIALSDKYKRFRRKISNAATRDPRLCAKESFHHPRNCTREGASIVIETPETATADDVSQSKLKFSKENLLRASNHSFEIPNLMTPPNGRSLRSSVPLCNHNLGHYPNANIHLDQPKQQPQNESNGDYWRRKALEKAEQNRKAQEAKVSDTNIRSTPFKIPFMMPASGSSLTQVRNRSPFTQHNKTPYPNKNISMGQKELQSPKEATTYREYQRRREAQQEERRREREAATVSGQNAVDAVVSD